MDNVIAIPCIRGDHSKSPTLLEWASLDGESSNLRVSRCLHIVGVGGRHPQFDGAAADLSAGLGGVDQHQFLALLILSRTEADVARIRGGDITQGFVLRWGGWRSRVMHHPVTGQVYPPQSQKTKDYPEEQSHHRAR
jgi:hypothetical protein